MVCFSGCLSVYKAGPGETPGSSRPMDPLREGVGIPCCSLLMTVMRHSDNEDNNATVKLLDTCGTCSSHTATESH